MGVTSHILVPVFPYLYVANVESQGKVLGQHAVGPGIVTLYEDVAQVCGGGEILRIHAMGAVTCGYDLSGEEAEGIKDIQQCIGQGDDIQAFKVRQPLHVDRKAKVIGLHPVGCFTLCLDLSKVKGQSHILRAHAH